MTLKEIIRALKIVDKTCKREKEPYYRGDYVSCILTNTDDIEVKFLDKKLKGK